MPATHNVTANVTPRGSHALAIALRTRTTHEALGAIARNAHRQVHLEHMSQNSANGPTPDVRQFLQEQLNSPQLDAVVHGDGPLLILAGAGSGKTRVIAYRVAYLIRERQIRPWQILAVTFTNKAAKELVHRVTDLAGAEQAKQVRMGTFHGLCARFLRQDIEHLGRRYTKDFTIYDTDDQVRALKREYEKAGISQKETSPTSVVHAISRYKDRLVTPTQALDEARLPFEKTVAALYRRYQDALVEANAVDFGDLVNLVLDLLERFPEVRQRYADRYGHVLVDEYQDVNEAQYRLVKAVAGGHRNLTVVGDDSQAIYGWRGADVQYILQYETDFPEAKIIRLEQNYRSTQNILVAAQSVEAGLLKRHPKELWTSNARGEPIIGVIANTQEDEAGFLLREIDRLNGIGVRNRDIAVLYRTNAQSRTLEDHFVRRRVGYQLVGGTRFYERREIREVVAYLRLLVNPYDADAFARAGATRRGLGETTVTKVIAWAEASSRSIVDGIIGLLRDQGALSSDLDSTVLASPVSIDHLPWNRRAHELILTFARDLDALRLGLQTLALPDLFDLLVQRARVKEYLLEGRDDNGEERWENVQELRSVMAEYGGDPAPEGLRLFLDNAALVSDADTIEDETEVDRVTLMTMHTAKGLEYPVVFITGMEENIFPHLRALEEGNHDEERRLCYVGFTRAMRHLYVIGCRSRMFRGFISDNDPSRFLSDIPQEVIRWVDGNGFRIDPARTQSIALGAWPQVGTGAQGSWGRTAALTRDDDAPTPIRDWSGGATRIGGSGSRPATSLPNNASQSIPKPLRVVGSTERPSLADIPGLRRASEIAPPPPTPSFHVDDRVLHATFGEGTVTSVEQSRSGEAMVQVRFDTVGLKKLAVAFANLMRVD